MAVARFQPSDLNHLPLLRETFFSGEPELATLDKLPQAVYMHPAGSLYYGRFRVAWVITTLPFRWIYCIFLYSAATLIACIRLKRAANHLYLRARRWNETTDCVLRQLTWGRNLLVPAFNTYREDASYLIDYEPIPKQKLKNPAIRDALTLPQVQFDWPGLCHGATCWFNYLFLLGLQKQTALTERCDSVAEYMRAIGELFKDGQPLQAALLQSLYRPIHYLLLGVWEAPTKILKKDWDDRKKAAQFIRNLPEGIYHIEIPGVHALSLYTSPKETIVFDSEIGVVQIDELETLVKLIGSYIPETPAVSELYFIRQAFQPTFSLRSLIFG